MLTRSRPRHDHSCKRHLSADSHAYLELVLGKYLINPPTTPQLITQMVWIISLQVHIYNNYKFAIPGHFVCVCVKEGFFLNETGYNPLFLHEEIRIRQCFN